MAPQGRSITLTPLDGVTQIFLRCPAGTLNAAGFSLPLLSHLRLSASSDALIITLRLVSFLALQGHSHSAAPVSMLAHYTPTV